MRKIRVFLLTGLTLLCFSAMAYAEWQIQFDAEADRVLHLGGVTLRGNFATAEECDAYWRSRPAFEQNHSKCVGCDSPGTGYGYSTSDDYYYQTEDPDEQLDFMLSMLFPIPIADGVFRGGQWFFTDLFCHKTCNKSFWQRYTDTVCQNMPLKENGCSGGLYSRLGGMP
jgi:hypothetical protein